MESKPYASARKDVVWYPGAGPRFMALLIPLVFGC